MLTETNSTLFRKFEGDIAHDVHQFVRKYNRSFAKKDIVAQNVSVLVEINTYLKSETTLLRLEKIEAVLEELQCAWMMLLEEIAEEAKYTTAPPDFLSFDAWLVWLEQASVAIEIQSVQN
mgnify:CR=1 FL=1